MVFSSGLGKALDFPELGGAAKILNFNFGEAGENKIPKKKFIFFGMGLFAGG